MRINLQRIAMRLKKLKRRLLAGASLAVIGALLIATVRNDSEAIKRAQEGGKVLQLVASMSATSTMTWSSSVFVNHTTGARSEAPAVPRKPVASVRADPGKKGSSSDSGSEG
jgi:hypothetical protein